MLPGLPGQSQDIARLKLLEGAAKERQGDFDGALDAYEAALAAAPGMAEPLSRFTGILEMAQTERFHAGLARRIRLALGTPGVNAEALSRPAALQLRHKYAGAPEPDLDAAASDDLLRLFLRRAINRDLALEPALIAMRDALAARLKAGEAAPELCRLAGSLALQSFNNEYIWPAVADPPGPEAFAAAQPGAGAARVREADLLRFALARPLADLPEAAAWAAIPPGDWPESLRELAERTLRQPLEEIGIAEALPSATEIGDGASVAVRQMYEENPYPRWLVMPRKPKVDILKAVAERFPGVTPPQPPEGPLQVLMPGAGTGQHPLSVATGYENVEVTAVDLSRRSLAYGKRMAGALNVRNIAFLHGDILKLDALDKRFPLIECVGVLHHLAEPDEGFKALARRLLPGGLIRIGLYGEHARQDVVAGRRLIEEARIPETLEGLRAFRQTAIQADAASPLAPLTARDDFFSASLLRDLVFHRQEMRYTIPRLRQSLAAANLTFLGFEFAAGFSRRQHDRHPAQEAYRAAWPDDPAMADLARWQRLEAREPGLFPGYSFWCQGR